MRRLLMPLLFTLLIPFLSTPATAVAVALPGGKANFVVAIGSLSSGSARDNWVRLGNYQFSTDGSVRARTYLWWQRAPVDRQSTGTKPDGSCSTSRLAVGQTLVRTCNVLTAGGYMANPTETRTGRFAITDSRLHITWNTGQEWSEQWTIASHPDGKLARLDFAFNTLANYGYAYGSNAPLTARRAMDSVKTYVGELAQDQVNWAHDKIARTPAAGGAFNLPVFRNCSTTTWCLTYLQPSSMNACQESGGCEGTGGGSTINDSSLQNYIVQVSSGDRRDTHWHWCTCRTRNKNGTDKEACYGGNSHVKPMMQIIDDDSGFRGWVGVEASFYPFHDIPDPRESDMLSVFRVTGFR
ncbi:hypothetical protein ACIBQX_13600 [Nonomuraea sp. NPDC049714]|uniref:hypothetical protein n=1 Tax=Nonomuraea sp. NPDC049714 TaxID=3364357 RepID=UPI0037979742